MKLRSGVVPLFALLALGVGMAGCSGDDGKDGINGTNGTNGTDGADGATGPAGPAGATGATGAAGAPGATGATGATGAGDYMAKVQSENCDYCHATGGLARGGQDHQNLYDKYTDPSTLVLDISAPLGVTGTAAPYTVTLTFTVTKAGQPVTSAASLLSQGFYISRWDNTAKEFRDGQISFTVGSCNSSGVCTATASTPFNPLTADGAVVLAKVAQDKLAIEARYSGRVTMYDNVGEDMMVLGTASTYESAANVESCEACHGKPYMKHGNIKASIAGSPDFTSCKTCHYDDKVGGHEEWQYMVDDPLGWATDATPTANYDYKAKLMNDVHMSHAMEFAYPQSMANCATCHAGKLDVVLADAQFTAETCKSCHPRQERDPKYINPKRAPSMEEIWIERGVDGFSFHPVEMNNDCAVCHDGNEAPDFKSLHSGYNAAIYNPETGARWKDSKKVSITSVTKTGDVVNVKFSATDTAIKPELIASFYAYGTKDYLISSHTRDAANKYRYEYPVGTNLDTDTTNDIPLFTERATGVAGTWDVDINLAAYTPATSTGLAKIPALITAKKVSKIEISLLPALVMDIDGEEVEIAAAGARGTYDLTQTGTLTSNPNYYAGTNAIVTNENCNACHDALGTTFHGPDYGADVQFCRNCHVPTSPGSHLEMQSRSIDSYVHAIHRMQWFDPGCRDGSGTTSCSTDLTDPVEKKHYEEHTAATWPLFTANACEGCHAPGKFDKVLDKASLPGQISAAAVNITSDWARGPQNAMVVGPADKACVSCHRAAAINRDDTEALNDLNAHMDGQSYMIDATSTNPSTTSWIYRVIDKMMNLLY